MLRDQGQERGQGQGGGHGRGGASKAGSQGGASARRSRILTDSLNRSLVSTRAAWLAAALRTSLAACVVSAWVLLAGPPLLLWTLLTRQTGPLYAAGAFGVRLGFLIVGLTIRTEGVEHMPAGGAVYACNHSSNVEAPAMFWSLRSRFPRVRVLYKAELRKLPVLVWVFDAAGFVPLERANKEQSWPAIDRAAGALRDGQSFFIFPEGTRSRTGELLPFKKGGFVMALKAQAPIVPVAVIGGRAAMRKGSALIWPATVVVSFRPPVQTVGRSIDDRDAVVAEVRAAIAARLFAPFSG